MESLAILALLIVALIIVAPILLFVGQSNLKKRFTALEQRFRSLEDSFKQLQQRHAAALRTDSMGPAERQTVSPQPAAVAETDAKDNAPPISMEATSDDARPKGPETPPDVTSGDVPPPPARRPDHVQQFIAWTKENWVLAAGAISLALAGVFLVQYGAERGLLTPPARVGVALVFGLLLLAAGEVLRRRFGDEDDGPMRFLPSALSGAGFFTLFAAILAARGLYDLIGPGAAFAGLVVVSALSVVFGWFYGALLSAVGIVGSLLAPYLVGGDTDSPWLLSYYFLLIALAALAIDSFKRWAWLSVLALAGAAGSIWLIYLASGFPIHFLATTLLVGFGAIALPERRLRPTLDGPPVAGLILGLRTQRFPTWLAFAAVANAALATFSVGVDGGLAEGYLALIVLAVLFAVTLFGVSKAPALSDLVLLPGVAFLALIAAQTGGLYRDFQRIPAPEAAPPWTAAQLVVMALVASVLVALRASASTDPRMALFRSLGAAVFAPTTVFLLEFLWIPTTQYGTTGWALMVIGAAAVMTVLSERALAQKSLPEPHLHSAFFAGAAIALIGLALFIVLTKTALTLALALMVLVVIGIDRRFDLPLLDLFVQLGLLVLSYRIVVDPGIFWMSRSTTSLSDILLSHLGTASLLAAALALVRPDRPRQRAGIEGALSIIAAAFVFVIFERYLSRAFGADHAQFGLLATLWLVVSLVQLRATLGAGRFERVLRLTVASLIGALALLATGLLFTLANPLFTGSGRVSGPPFLSSLALAYLPLAGVLAFAALRLTHLPRLVRRAAGALSSGLAVWYVALSIRHFWRGAILSRPGVSDPELYSYTLAMLVASAGLLAVAFQRRSRTLRTGAMVLVGLTIAKVFLVDMAGLTGLMRVLSFMGLGLALLALTWLNRVMEAQWTRRAPEAP